MGRRRRRVPAALKLTLTEAMAVVLSARLMVRYADKYDADLAAAFEKLQEVLPRPLAEHVNRTLTVLAGHPRDEEFSRRVHLLARAWAERRVVELAYEPAPYAPDAAPRRAVVHPYLIEPSLHTHALYLIGWDETRNGLRTFKVERIRDVAADAADIRAAGARDRRGGHDRDDPPASLGHHRGPAPGRGRAALCTGRRLARPRGHLAPEPARRAGARRIAACGAPRSPARSRSGCGSCSGAPTSKSSNRPNCAPTWRAPWSARSPPTGPESRFGRPGSQGPRKVPDGNCKPSTTPEG